MLTLTVDFTSDLGSVSVSHDEEIESLISLNLHRQPLRFCAHAIQSALELAGHQVDNVDLLCTVIGPGSWTGLRVSSTVMNALAFTLGVPHVPVSLFEAFRFAVPNLERATKAVVQISSTQLAVARLGSGDEPGMEDRQVRLDDLPDDLECDQVVVKASRATYGILSSLYEYTDFIAADALQPPVISATNLALERYNKAATAWGLPVAPYYGSPAIG